jgi:hypothetical protein
VFIHAQWAIRLQPLAGFCIHEKLKFKENSPTDQFGFLK